MKKDVPIPKKGTTQPCQRGVNVDHEKSLGNCLYNGIDIYIYIYYDGSQYKDIYIYIYIFYIWNTWW